MTAQPLSEPTRLSDESGSSDGWEAAPDALVIIDDQGQIQLVNDQAVVLFGYSRDELLGSPLEMLMVERFQSGHTALRAAYQRHPRTRGASSLSLDLFGRRKDASEFPVEISLNAVAPAGTGLTSVVIRGVADHKHLEHVLRIKNIGLEGALASIQRVNEELELALEKLDAFSQSVSITQTGMLQASLDAVLTVDHTGALVEFSPSAERMFGYKRASVLGRTLPETILPAAVVGVEHLDLDRFLTASGGDMRHQARFELTALRADGRQIPIEMAIVRMAANGLPLFVSSVRDLTERDVSRAAQVRLAAIVESSEDAIISKTLEGVVTSWNPAAERLYGYTTHEMVGQPISRIMPPEREADMAYILQRVGRGERISRYETIRVRKDGSRVYVTLSVSPLRGPDGTIVGAATITHDISDRRASEAKVLELNTHLEERVVERTAELEAANKALESFSYSVSHDLRSPLRAINGFSRILLSEHGTSLPPDSQEYLRLVADNATYMGELIDGLLLLSRINDQPLHKQSVEVGPLVHAIVGLLLPEQANRQIDIRIDEHLPPCQGNPTLIKQVFVNLISNALKFTGRRELGRIEIGHHQTDRELTYFVRDNGAGFDMRYASKLFGVFQRFHTTEDFNGTGVGLAIAQRIVDRHGGRIWAESAVDQGATFSFSLPLQRLTA